MKVKNILVSQPRPQDQKSPYFDIEKKYGVHINFRPFIRVEPLTVKEFRQQHIDPRDYTAVIFTAKVGIDNYFRLCKEMRFEVPETMKYFCVTDKISFYLSTYVQYRKRKVFFPASGKLQDLPEICKKHEDEKYLLVSSDVNNENTVKMFEDAGLNPKLAVMYRTVSNDFTADETFDYDLLAFFSPAGVASLMKNFPEFKQGEIGIAAMGSTTVKAVKDNHLRLDVQVPSPQYTSMSAAIEGYIIEANKKK